jgi:hypothetical protein
MKNKRKICIFSFVLIFILADFPSDVTYSDTFPSDVITKFTSSIVSIVALDKDNNPLAVGKGFFINSEGDIATNHHVLAGSSKALIRTADGEKGRIIGIVNDDPGSDLLIARTSLKTTHPVPLGDSDTLTQGENIIALGNPVGLGVISNIKEVNNLKFLQITAPITPGCSGGPVFNSDGKVVGIATAFLHIGNSHNFAMPVNYLKSLKKPGNDEPAALIVTAFHTGNKRDENALVRVHDIHHYYTYFGYLSDVDLVIQNMSDYPIKDIELFFIYRDHNDEIVGHSVKYIDETIPSHVSFQTIHNHYVRHFNQNGKEGNVEIRVLDYHIAPPDKPSPLK